MELTQQNKLRTAVKHWEPCNSNNNTVWKTKQQTLNYLRDSLLSYILSFARLVEHSFMVPRARNPCLPTHQKEKCSTPPLSVYQTKQSDCVSQTVRLDSQTRQSDCVRGSLPSTRLAPPTAKLCSVSPLSRILAPGIQTYCEAEHKKHLKI